MSGFLQCMTMKNRDPWSEVLKNRRNAPYDGVGKIFVIFGNQNSGKTHTAWLVYNLLKSRSNCDGLFETHEEQKVLTYDEVLHHIIETFNNPSTPAISDFRAIIEINKERVDTLEYIAIDSLYSPVKKVSYSVENARVGQDMNYDKLTLEVETNGTTPARDVVSLAGKIIQEHVGLFVELCDEMSGVNILVSKEEDERQDKANKRDKKDNEDDKDNQLMEMFANNKDQSQDIDIAMMTGCTSCVVLIDEAKKLIYFANAGDSRAVLCKKGKAYQMSLDHKPDLFIEKNRIYSAGGWVNEGRIKGNLNLSRSLGDLEYKGNAALEAKDQMITAFPDIVVEKYNEECDFIIIGCDGIWDCLTNQEACDYVKERIGKMKLSEIVENMMDSIIADSKMNETGVGCDNMTCIIVQFKH